MPSPFPGMDPYLEINPYWAQLHSNLITAMQGELKKRLPRKYSVWSDIHIWLHEPDAATRMKMFEPDVFMTEDAAEASLGTAVAALSAPTTTLLPAIRRKGNRYLKIKEVRSEHVVTVVELLSPTNKTPGEHYDAHLAKHNEYLATRTNLVEIDLLRTGQRMPLGRPRPPKADYYALICRAIDFPRTAIWHWTVRDQLPDLPIPLNPEDGFVTLPLQGCFDWAYDLGPYDKEMDYGQPPAIQLGRADTAWARQLLAKRIPTAT